MRRPGISPIKDINNKQIRSLLSKSPLGSSLKKPLNGGRSSTPALKSQRLVFDTLLNPDKNLGDCIVEGQNKM